MCAFSSVPSFGGTNVIPPPPKKAEQNGCYFHSPAYASLFQRVNQGLCLRTGDSGGETTEAFTPEPIIPHPLPPILLPPLSLPTPLPEPKYRVRFPLAGGHSLPLPSSPRQATSPSSEPSLSLMSLCYLPPSMAMEIPAARAPLAGRGPRHLVPIVRRGLLVMGGELLFAGRGQAG